MSGNLDPVEPEPADDESADAERHAEVADSLSLALLLLLERLSPVERAVFLLHDVFAYEYGEVAAVVGGTEAGTRRLAVRARRHVVANRPRLAHARAEPDGRPTHVMTIGVLDGVVQTVRTNTPGA
jgi:RNA polymerase sigma-70 factor, ECF subfamily